MSCASNNKAQTKYINLFDRSFLTPIPQNHFGPTKKSLCAPFPGKERKKGTHINFFADFGVKTGVSKWPFCQELPRQTKPKKGPKRKVHEFRPFL